MKKNEKFEIIEKLLTSIEKQIPNYISITENSSISGGNVAVCIIDEEGQTYGKMYGNNKIRQRYFYQIAWSKASQAWITNQPTGKFEQLVFNEQIDDKEFGIKRHDFIGWQGGLPIKLKDINLSIGFSGFREENDLEIVTNAVKELTKS